MALGLQFPDGELTEALRLGVPSDRSVRAWLRAPEHAAVEVTLTSGAVRCSTTALPDPGHDWIATVDLELDRPLPGELFAVVVLCDDRGPAGHGEAAGDREFPYPRDSSHCESLRFRLTIDVLDR